MRVCSRQGCGTVLLKPDGLTPDFSKRRFCGAACAKADLRDKMRAKREVVKDYKVCHECGCKVAYSTRVRRNKGRRATLETQVGEMPIEPSGHDLGA